MQIIWMIWRWNTKKEGYDILTTVKDFTTKEIVDNNLKKIIDLKMLKEFYQDKSARYVNINLKKKVEVLKKKAEEEAKKEGK